MSLGTRAAHDIRAGILDGRAAVPHTLAQWRTTSDAYRAGWHRGDMLRYGASPRVSHMTVRDVRAWRRFWRWEDAKKVLASLIRMR